MLIPSVYARFGRPVRGVPHAAQHDRVATSVQAFVLRQTLRIAPAAAWCNALLDSDYRDAATVDTWWYFPRKTTPATRRVLPMSTSGLPLSNTTSA